MATSEEFNVAGKDMVDYICNYHDNIEERPPLSQVCPGYLKDLIPSEAPEKPESWDDVKKDIERVIMPGVTHWQSPHFHAYFGTGHSFPSLLGDMLSGGIGCVAFSWMASPACTELETIVMNWLGKMIGLPETFLAGEDSLGGGAILGSASESVLMPLLAAKMKMIRKQQELNPDLDHYDILPKLVAYSTDQSHSCVAKAAMISSVRMRVLPTDERNALRGDTLIEAMRKDRKKGLIPTFVCATLGTTDSLAFDQISEIGPVCKDANVWLHIDAAYAGCAFICPEFRYLLNGIEYASSFNASPMKLLRVNFDLSALWVRDKRDITGAINVDQPILQQDHQGLVEDYRHWQIPLGRRFRSLKLWFVLRMFGVKNLQEHIRYQVKLAKEFEALVLADPRFTIEAEVILGLVCFGLKGPNEQNKELIDKIIKSGKIYMTGTYVKGKFLLRFVVCPATTDSSHIIYAWQVIQDCADGISTAINGN